MSHPTNLVTNTGAPHDPPVKRKRGRPRKDETQAQAQGEPSPALNKPPLRPPVTRAQGEGSSAPGITSKGKDRMEVDIDPPGDDDGNNDDQMVGQVVIGVLECAFDAGYFVTVRVGDTDSYMRGVVFKEGGVVSVTPENDIAPNAKMYKRRDIPIPVAPGVCLSKPMEKTEDQQQQVKSDQQDQSAIPFNNGQQQQDKLSAQVSPQELKGQNPELLPIAVDQGDKVPPEELSCQASLPSVDQKAAAHESEPTEKLTEVVGGGINGSDLPEGKMLVEFALTKAGTEPTCEVEEKQDSPVKASHSNGQASKDGHAIEEGSEKGGSVSAPKSDTASAATDPGLAVKKPVLEVEFKPDVNGGSGFQISMENAENDDHLSEPPAAEVSPMETE